MNSKLLVTIPQGSLQGTTYTSEFSGQVFNAFLGIPYAKPPVNELRFMPPVPAGQWDGTLDATKERDDCLHHCAFRNVLVGSEDCLYLNIYTPQPPCDIEVPKAVIVLVHCGANNWGSGSSMNFGAPDFIVHHDVIFVTFNYRLHIFGFLNLNLPECTGNMGLKDQVMAFRWVKENIKYFGGDSNNITLFGGSSGATDIHLHMMSPLSKGLYDKVILQGGYGLSRQWALMDDPLERASELGRLLEFKGDSVEKLCQFLKNMPVEELMKGCAALRPFTRRGHEEAPVTFIPSIEIFEEGAFLSCSPTKLLYNVPPVPMIATMCEAEGSSIFVADPFCICKKGLPYVIESNLKPLYKINAETLRNVTKKVQVFYFGQSKEYESMFPKIVDLHSDMWLNQWQNMVDHQAKSAPVYLQLFTFMGKYNFQTNVFISKKFSKGLRSRFGTLHGDDLSYFIYHKILKETMNFHYEFGPRETKTINDMTTMFTNFAKKGDPNGNLSENVQWKPHTPQHPRYLKFDDKLTMVDGIIRGKRTEFWTSIIKYVLENEDSE